MALTDLLVHEVAVYRRSGRRDRFGQEIHVNPSLDPGDLVATYPCRLTRGRGGMVMKERAVDVFEVRFRLYTAPDVDIEEDDSVVVTDPYSGIELLPQSKITNKTYASDGRGVHHAEFDILVQRGPQ